MAHFQDGEGTVGAQKSQAEMQAFLDAEQYAEKEIFKYECCFGPGFMSAGGIDTTREYCAKLGPLPEGCKVLDIGCGIGGSAFYFADTYGAEVLGVDLATNSVRLAQHRSKQRDEKLALSGGGASASATKKGCCTFEVRDALEAEFEEGSFDVVYSRDALLHITYEDKPKLMALIFKWLKPRGQFLCSDYGKGEAQSVGPMSASFQAYCDRRGYNLLTPGEYKALCVNAGFQENKVNSEDRSWQYCTVSRTEIDRISLPGGGREAFLAAYSEGELASLRKVFADKVDMTVRGDRSFVVCHAVKAPSFSDLRTAVCAAAKKLYADGFVLGTDGNVSARVAPGSDLIVIKPSGVPYEELTPDHMVLCTVEGVPSAGETFKPSSEINLHTGVYKARADVGGIVHTHSMYAGALSCTRQDLPCYHYSVGELTAGDSVKCTGYHTYGTPELGDDCVKHLGDDYAVLIANHGAVTVGADLDSAVYVARRLERECEMYHKALTLAPGGPVVLGKADMDACRTRDKTYGQPPAEGSGAEGTGHGLAGGGNVGSSGPGGFTMACCN